MNEEPWLTYQEAADQLGLSKAALRQKAIRGRWSRTRGNDGQARVQVPSEPDTVRTRNVRRPSPAELTARIETLETELARAEESVRVHRTDYERERDRADIADARALAAEARATASVEGRARADARADRLVADLAALAARMADKLTPGPEPESEPVRPWWQRWRRRA